MVKLNSHYQARVLLCLGTILDKERILGDTFSHMKRQNLWGKIPPIECAESEQGRGDKKEGFCCCYGELEHRILISVSRNVVESGRVDTVAWFEGCGKSHSSSTGYRKTWCWYEGSQPLKWQLFFISLGKGMVKQRHCSSASPSNL